MNRSIALFVALAVLVAHALALRIDGSGSLTPPYDPAFITYRVARKLVYEGAWIWNPGTSGLDASPSVVWVLVCALFERLYVSINLWVRVVGVLATATSFILASRFQADRAASLITPMLLAISGSMAAAAVSGTETALLTMLVTGAFLAFERRRDGWLGLLLLLCGLTRAEGWILAALFFALRLNERRRARSEGGEELPALRHFLLPATGAVAMAAIHWKVTGYFLAPWFESLLRAGNRSWRPGLGYLEDFFLSTASPALLVYSVWYLLRGRLSRTGSRALFLFLAWSLLVLMSGGGRTPFCETMVPVLPIALISAQEGMITALNSTRRVIRSLAWASFLGAILASAMASLHPDDLRPLPLASLQERWMRPSATPRFGYVDRLGRPGLAEEIAGTRDLRAIGLFLRDHVDPSSTVLTPWPGSVGYLSDLLVYDLQGRATRAPGADHPSPRAIHSRVDVLAAIEAAPDYLTPVIRPQEKPPSIESVAAKWVRELDAFPALPGRLEAVTGALDDEYELITIPLSVEDDGGPSWSRHNVLLRRRALGLTPRLRGSWIRGKLTVYVEHRGHWQLADLSIVGVDEGGEEHSLSPTGRFLPGGGAMARSELLLTETGERPMTLISCSPEEIPPGLESVRVQLRNPGALGHERSALVSTELVLRSK